jgi:carboxyl-terminal processing protease
VAKWNLSCLLGVVLVAVLGLTLTYSSPPPQNKHENLKLLVDIMELVDDRYVKPLSPERKRTFTEDMANGGLEKLDPHSGFLNAEEWKQFNKQSEGSFGGIGIRIGMDGGQVYVESPMVGTPAYDAGVLAGDIILKIDGASTKNMKLREVVDKITGEPKTKVTLNVLHEGFKDPAKDAVDIEITRDIIKIDSVLGDEPLKEKLGEWNYWVDPNTKIAYIRITSFTRTTVAELTSVVSFLQKNGMQGLIVDLRNNPGGLLQAAVEVSSVFLPEGEKVVTTKGRGEGNEIIYNSKHGNLNFKPKNDYPLVIMINRYSASASEIVAAALQDHLRAIIVGERSFGKGSVQNVIPMENNTTALKLTTASYWRPSGKNIHRFPESTKEDDWGVLPNKGFDFELSLEERIEYLKYRQARDVIRPEGQRKKEEPKSDKDGKKKEEFKDRVLEKAKEYINEKLKEKAGKAQMQPPPPALRPGQASDDPTRTMGALTPGRPNRFLRPIPAEVRLLG